MKYTTPRLICGFLCAVLLQACGLTSLAPSQAPRTYLLDLPFNGSAATSSSKRELLMVTRPIAAAGFNSTRIVYVSEIHALEHYNLSQWADTPPKMLMPLLTYSLEQSGQFSQVIAAPAPVSGRWRLDTEILRLQHEFTANPSQVRLVTRVRLFDMNNRSILATRLFEEVVKATGENAESGVVAANTAVKQLLDKLNVFIEETLQETL